MKEKALRDAQITSIHDMGELKRAKALRVDGFSVQKLRQSHATIQELTSQIQELHERVNCMSDSGEFQDIESKYSGKFSHVPSQTAVVPSPRFMLSRDRSMPLGTWNLSGPQRIIFLAIQHLIKEFFTRRLQVLQVQSQWQEVKNEL